VFTDPLAVTYSGSPLLLPRTATGKRYTRYTTADGEFVIFIAKSFAQGGDSRVDIIFTRNVPDPTPGDQSGSRYVRNSFGFSYGFDPLTRAEAFSDIPKLRSALDSLVNSTFQSRLIGGEG
jgi:hypothetical protein